MTGRRIVSISLPQFPIECWNRRREQRGDLPGHDVPVALTIEGAHGPVVHSANRTARLAGVQEGGRIADMRAFCPDMQVDYADTGAEAATLERLVFWARRWCPWTAADGARGLILDTTGADHLWGGEAAMLVDIEAQLSLLGFSARLAVAPTLGAAWGLARHGGAVRAICTQDEVAQKLAVLPMAALRLDPATLLLLHRLGLKRVEHLTDLPRLSLARRFNRAGPDGNPLIRLDQAMGRLAEPPSWPGEVPQFRVLARLAEPVQDPTHFLPGMCADLCRHLAAQAQGCRRLRVTVFRTDGEVSHVTVATALPSRDAAHLQRLFDGKLERINPGYGFDLITLEALVVEPLAAVQTRTDGVADPTLMLAQLVDRLSARFGAKAITRPVLRASHIPERAEALVSALAVADVALHLPNRERPVRLLAPPEEVRVLYAVPEGPPVQFIWRKQTHRITRHAGPERISPEWWHDRPGSRLRDYFKVEVDRGQRFWMYREGLHDDGRGGDPRWFVHGVFA